VKGQTKDTHSIKNYTIDSGLEPPFFEILQNSFFEDFILYACVCRISNYGNPSPLYYGKTFDDAGV
jgi:hypothetical protein